MSLTVNLDSMHISKFVIFFGLITSFYHILSYIIYHHILSYRIIYYHIYLLWKLIILSRANHGQIILLLSICHGGAFEASFDPRATPSAKGQRVPARHRSPKPHPRSRHRRPGDANGFVGFMVNSLTFYMANYHLVI